MQSRMFFLGCLLISFCALPQSSYARDYIGFGCAPWDGQTFVITITTPEGTLDVQIWMQGLTDLRNGKRTIVLDNRGAGGGDADATGRAMRRTTTDKIPNDVKATVFFDELDFKEGGKASGFILLPGDKKYPFQGTIGAASPCG